MARQRQRARGLRKLLQIVATVIWIAIFVALYWKFGGNACEVFLYVSCLVASLIAVVSERCPPRHQLQQSALAKAEVIIQMSIDPLARRRAQLVYIDDHGSPHLEEWQAEIDNFIAHRVLPMLTPKERASLPGDPAGTLHLLTLRKLHRVDESDSNACADN